MEIDQFVTRWRDWPTAVFRSGTSTVNRMHTASLSAVAYTGAMDRDVLIFKLQFQVAIAAGLAALSLFMFALLFKSGILLALAALFALCVPLTFLVGILYVIYRKD
jgi:hypothetical protein